LHDDIISLILMFVALLALWFYLLKLAHIGILLTNCKVIVKMKIFIGDKFN